MLQLAIQALELGREQLVIRGWGSRGDGSFASQQHLRLEERFSHLAKDELVQLIRSDAALLAPTLFTACAVLIVVLAAVVATRNTVTIAHLPALGTQVATPAPDQPSQQPAFGSGVAWAEGRVIPTHQLRSLEDLLADDGWDWDRDPFVPGAQPVPGRMLAATGRRQGLHMVEERPTGIHRVA
jgi:hypothetical protein